MALLDDQSKDALSGAVQRELSSRFEAIPLSKAAVRAGVDIFDTQLEACEQAIVAAMPPNAAAWLTGKPSIAREILIAVEQKRKAVL